MTDALNLRRWTAIGAEPPAGPAFMFDGDLPDDLSRVTVVMPGGGRERARELARRGADCVLLGEAALRDSTLIPSLIAELGEGRAGVWVPARRMSVSWALDRDSNADFRCVAPSRPAPAWDVLDSQGNGTGTDAAWWTGEMLKRGAAMALHAVDMGDADLNICAGLTEEYGPRLWFTPLREPDADLRPWVQYGHVRNLVLPAGPRYGDEAVAALHGIVAPPAEAAA